MTHLKVAVRIRPCSSREIANQSEQIVAAEEFNTLAVTNLKVSPQNSGDSRERTRRFSFDYCFSSDVDQSQIFEAIGKEVREALEKSYHSCVLAYGQSFTGKTYTMMGEVGHPGLTPRICKSIFSYIQDIRNEEESPLKVTVSYLEIYNEKVRDLLANEGEKKIAKGKKPVLKVREHPKKGPYVQGLTEQIVDNAEELLRYLYLGNSNRKVAATLSNPHSSRSHSVFTVTCLEGVRLRLVDLAGSERAGSRCPNFSTFKEGANINKSLVALGNVISKLAEQSLKSKKRFVPYRDSVLTWLLKDTLGGNSKTVMIATISPSGSCYTETINTLRFGQTAKRVISSPITNEDPKERTIRELRAEIIRLRKLLENNGSTEEDSTFRLLKSNENHEKKLRFLTTIKKTDLSRENLVNSEKLIPLIQTVFNHVKMERRPSKLYGSHESISGPKKGFTKKHNSSPSATNLHEIKRSSHRNSVDLKEKGMVTEISEEVKKLAKPRSEIVAAVTNRLYAKVNRREVGTETDRIQDVDQKQASVRLRLQELSHRALRAHRRRHAETQTSDLFPVLRIKEVSTDMDDFNWKTMKVVDVETETELQTRDVGINCVVIEQFHPDGKNGFTVTRSCGTQSIETSKPATISFKKYLNLPKTSASNDASCSALDKNDNDTDSLEEEPNVNFPTPDIISNHNSLEPGSYVKLVRENEVKHAASVTIFYNYYLVNDMENSILTPSYATVAKTPHFSRITSRLTPTLVASQVYSFRMGNEYCTPLPRYIPHLVRLKSTIHSASNVENLVCLKPLVVRNRSLQTSRTQTRRLSKKKKLFDSLSTFVQEATTLVTNFNTASSFGCDLQVTLNNLPRSSGSWSSEEESLPINKFKGIVEESCSRLERTLNKIESKSTTEDSKVENIRNFSHHVHRDKMFHRLPSAYLRQLMSMRKHIVESSKQS